MLRHSLVGCLILMTATGRATGQQEPALRALADGQSFAPRLAARDSAFHSVKAFLARDSSLRSTRDGETRFVLLRLSDDNRLSLGPAFRDRQALHWAGRADGRFVMFGWFRPGEVSAARVYYYVSGSLGPPAAATPVPGP